MAANETEATANQKSASVNEFMSWRDPQDVVKQITPATKRGELDANQTMLKGQKHENNGNNEGFATVKKNAKTPARQYTEGIHRKIKLDDHPDPASAAHIQATYNQMVKHIDQNSNVRLNNPSPDQTAQPIILSLCPRDIVKLAVSGVSPPIRGSTSGE
ncbi:unnamed protein product [Clonostachys rhizophaga]|uniref:Uncharacterized protein n=1 Tax=Clonostachys rhizophaga TaxID=160324 RepID=A0A9N9VJP6_9HYPO|nr:unnamed protein product [Clonostachys rhizophaga]